MDLSASITYQITKCGVLLRQLSTKRMRDLGLDLTPEEATLLNQLWDRDNQSLSELGNWAIKEASTVTRQVDSLVKKGYVLRVRDEDDGRKVLARLTTEGKKLQKQFIKTGIPTMDEMLADISDEELRHALTAIMRIKEGALEALKE